METPKPITNKRVGRGDILVVAYYTVSTPYEVEIEKLQHSMEAISIDYVIEGVPNRKSWQANTQYKAIFLKEMVEQHPDRRLLYVDSDAIFRSYPHLLDTIQCDIAVHMGKRGALSGTIYVEPTTETMALLDLWILENHKLPMRWDQINLDNVIRRLKKDHKIKMVDLPPSYTFIFDIFRRDHPNTQPVIEHFQASRRFKHLVNS